MYHGASVSGIVERSPFGRHCSAISGEIEQCSVLELLRSWSLDHRLHIGNFWGFGGFYCLLVN